MLGQLGLARLDPGQCGGNRVYAIRALLLQLLAAGLTGLLVAGLATDAVGFQPTEGGAAPTQPLHGSTP